MWMLLAITILVIVYLIHALLNPEKY
ncbi:potassium-transporting ATPase subunit F [Rummeliibacillus suwonensis]|nr:potassium-transporting ATPase subunit F [Rummeliibacillus suwonensis]